MRKSCCIWLFCLLLLVTGCRDSRVIEELALIDTISADKAEKENDQDLLMIGVSIPKIDPRAKEPRETIFTTSRTFKEARIHISGQTSRRLVSGQVRNIMFGSELARDGIWKHIDTFVRDPSIGQRVKVVVVNGNAAKLLNSQYPQHGVIGYYIGELLDKQAAVSALPEVNMYNFSRDYLDDGIDPVAPVIIGQEKHISMDGIGLFRDDRYITKIPHEKSLIFTLLRGIIKQGEMSLDLSKGNEKKFLQVSSVVSGRKVKVKKTQHPTSRFEVYLQLELRGTVREYIGPSRLESYDDQKRMEKEVGEYLEKEAELMIRQMQRHQVDSIGIGQYVRNSMSYQEWKKLDWHSVYPQVPIHVNVRAKIKDFGKFE